MNICMSSIWLVTVYIKWVQLNKSKIVRVSSVSTTTTKDPTQLTPSDKYGALNEKINEKRYTHVHQIQFSVNVACMLW